VFSLLITFLLFTGPVSAADECKEFDLSSPGQCMSFIPPYDQKPLLGDPDTNICYAAAVANAVDCFRFTHGDPNDKRLSSPVYIAAIHSSKYNDPRDNRPLADLQAGWASQALKGIQDFGSCERNNIDSNVNSNLVRVYDAFEDFRMDRISKDEAIRRLNLCARSANSIEDLQRLSYGFQKHFSKANFVESVMHEVCKDKRIVPPQFHYFHIDKHLQTMTKADKTKLFIHGINREPSQPVLLSVNTKAYEKGNSKHSITAIGQRKKNGKCQVLLRDSYGTGNCEKLGYNHEVIECEKGKGQFWIDRDRLMENTLVMTWLYK
jgi:hypothetical protein